MTDTDFRLMLAAFDALDRTQREREIALQMRGDGCVDDYHRWRPFVGDPVPLSVFNGGTNPLRTLFPNPPAPGREEGGPSD